MTEIICKIKENLKNKINIVAISLIIFVLFFILGLVISLGDYFSEVLTNNAKEIYSNIFSYEFSPLKNFFKRILLICLLFVPVFIFSLNKISKYFIFIIIAIRGYSLALIFKIFAVNLLFIGVLIFIVSILLVNLAITLFVILYLVNVYEIEEKLCKNNLNKYLNYLIISLILSILASFVELLLNITIIRPIYVFFI